MFIFTTIFGFIARQAIALWELKMRILGFILDHWKAAIVVLILGIGFTHYIGLKRQLSVLKSETIVRKNETIAAKKALIDHIEIDSQAAKKREAENKLNAILAQKKTDANKAAYDAMIARLELNREKLEKDLHNEKSNIMRLYANARKLRDSQDSTASAGVSEIPLSTELLAERSDNNAIITLVDSSKETTANYNELMQTWLDYCNVYGCQDIQQSVIGVQDEVPH
jgi:hypothetical protein